MTQAERLTNRIGIFYLVPAILQAMPLFSLKIPHFLTVLIDISIGLRMFEKIGWFRILGILAAAYQLFWASRGFYVYFFRNDEPGPLSFSGDRQFLLPVLIIFLCANLLCLYVFFRPHVKELFKSK